MDKALLERVRKQAWFHRFPIGLPLALLVLGLALTLYLTLLAHQFALDERQAELERHTDSLKAELQRRADENVAYLVAAASLFKANTAVSSAEFSEYIADMSQGASARGALGLGWAVWSTAADDKATNALLTRLHPGLRRLAIHPADAPLTQSRAVIALLEPANEANIKAIGYDMRSESVRRAAIDAAIGSRRPTLSGPVRLVQGNGTKGVAGALIYVAVYRGSKEARTGAGAMPYGLVYSPIRVGEFVNGALTETAPSIDRVAIYDTAVAPANLLAAFGETPGKVIETRQTLKFGGRTWVIVAQENGGGSLQSTAAVIALAGLLISLLLMAIAWFITARAKQDRRVLEWLQTQVEIRSSLTRELNHRVKNTLANVLSIVSLTHRQARDLPSFVETLSGRLRALSATHDLLSERDWKDAPVRTIVEREIAPYLGNQGAAAQLSGPDIMLAPNDALSLGLALHELATNAAKYGALTEVDGRVTVDWHMREENICELTWRESGGPAVTKPSRRGFGLDLIEKIASHQLGQKINVSFDESGVTCVIPIPVRVSRWFQLHERDRPDGEAPAPV